VELVVDERDQPIERLPITTLPLAKQQRNVDRRFGRPVLPSSEAGFASAGKLPREIGPDRALKE
jgi:hypothetical protein